MQNALDQLPDDVDALKSLVAEQSIKLDHFVARNEQLESKVIILQEQLNIALAKRYAASSEKISPDQIRLFNEAEVDSEVVGTLAVDDEVVIVPEHQRRKRGRKPLPEELPRVDIVHEIPECGRCCDHDGRLLAEIGEVICEQLDIIPAKIQVIRHIRKKYACSCGQCIRLAPLPAQPIPKSLASPGLLAHITVSKYADALPLYRQETILRRIGVDIPRATLANWMIQVGTLIQPLINLLQDRLLGYDIVQMDDDCMDAGGRAMQEQLPKLRCKC
jgi:transposase